jgi:hypothetical protein
MQLIASEIVCAWTDSLEIVFGRLRLLAYSISVAHQSNPVDQE